MTRRTQRINELLRQEISLVLQRQLRDPRLSALVSITSVDTSEDLREAKIFVSIMGTGYEKTEALQGLDSASGYVRRELSDTLSLRQIPHLTFLLDESLERAQTVIKVMNQIVDEGQSADNEKCVENFHDADLRRC